MKKNNIGRKREELNNIELNQVSGGVSTGQLKIAQCLQESDLALAAGSGMRLQAAGSGMSDLALASGAGMRLQATASGMEAQAAGAGMRLQADSRIFG